MSNFQQLELSVAATMESLELRFPRAKYRALFAAIGTQGSRANPATAGEIAHYSGYRPESIYRSIERLGEALVEVGSPFRVRTKMINKQSTVYWIGIEK